MYGETSTSVQSSVQGLITLLAGANLGLVTLRDGAQYGDPPLANTIPPEDAPILLVFPPDPRKPLIESRKAGTASHGKWREFSLWLHLFAFYDDPLTSIAIFRALSDSIVSTIRGTAQLGHNADNSTSQVIFAGEQMTEGEDPWRTVANAGLPGGDPGIVRHWVGTVDIKELTIA